MKTPPTSFLLGLLAVGCTAEVPPTPPPEVVDRAPGDRTPRAADCEDVDAARCLLPWPSNTFAVPDPSTATGLRLEVPVRELNPRDDPSSLSLADGFSRVSPLLVRFDGPLDPSTLEAGISIRRIRDGRLDPEPAAPLRVETIPLEDTGETLLLADPMRVLEPNADYVVVVTDALHREDGTPVAPSRGTSLAMGLAEPTTQEEADVVGYFAPVRAALTDAGVEPGAVVRVWDFTTRSAENARAPLEHMRDACLAAVDDGSVSVSLTQVSFPDDPAIAMVVEGRLEGLPTFLDGDRGFVPGPDGLPQVQGTAAAPFRVVVPAGTGDYRFVMYGHGTGGNQLDDAFDSELAELGLAKVNIRFYGWTDVDVLLTLSNLQYMTEGSFSASADLDEGLAHGAAIERAMERQIGDLLSAETIDGMPNVAAGRRPDDSRPLWVGGSLGGTTGVIYAAVDPAIHYAVVNVPGAAWGQWVGHSRTFELIEELLLLRYEDRIDLATALAIGQTNLDMADGASWVDVLEESPTAYLVQESMGDPVLPNPGTEMVAVITGARHVGGILEPIAGVEPADEVIDGSGITQFQTPPGGGVYDIHGFAARGTGAGVAAREQIFEFVRTALEGSSRIAPPPSCPADGCVFDM